MRMSGGQLPDHTTRLKLDRALTQTSFEHLIVFPTHDWAAAVLDVGPA